MSQKVKRNNSDISGNKKTFLDRNYSMVIAMRKLYGYARVSTQEQNLDRQIKALLEAGVDERDIITDKASGKSLDREGYQMLKTRLLRPGDILVIVSLDRLSRNKMHIKQELEYYRVNKIRIMVIDIPTTMVELPEEQSWVFEMINNILIEVLSSIAEQERVRIRKNQADGISAAKEKGKHLGRPRKTFPPSWEEVYPRWKAGKITAVAAMAELDLKKSTFYNLVNQWEDTEETPLQS